MNKENDTLKNNVDSGQVITTNAGSLKAKLNEAESHLQQFSNNVTPYQMEIENLKSERDNL